MYYLRATCWSIVQVTEDSRWQVHIKLWQILAYKDWFFNSVFTMYQNKYTMFHRILLQTIDFTSFFSIIIQTFNTSPRLQTLPKLEIYNQPFPSPVNSSPCSLRPRSSALIQGGQRSKGCKSLVCLPVDMVGGWCLVVTFHNEWSFVLWVTDSKREVRCWSLGNVHL